MNIAVYLPASSLIEANSTDKFIVETLFFLFQQHPEHKFIILANNKTADQFPFYLNIEKVVLKPISKNRVLKKIWLDVKLPAILKRAKADLLISSDNTCSQAVSIPQCLFIQDIEKVRKTHIKKAQLLLITNNLMKRELIEKHDVPEKKIVVIPPSANRIFEPIDGEKKRS